MRGKQPNKLNPDRISRKTEKALESIRQTYEFGVQANQQTKTATRADGYGYSVVSAFSAREGIAPSTAYAAKQMAKVYSKFELDEYIEACREHNTPLGSHHLFAAMTVKDKQLRGRLLNQAITDNWPVKRLREEIAATCKNK